MKNKLTKEKELEVEAKVKELSEKHKCVIYPLVFIVGDEAPVIGYLKEPPRWVKLKTMDKALTQAMTASSEIVDAYLIREESDPKIYSEDSENDKYYIGAVNTAYQMIEMAVNQLKKK